MSKIRYACAHAACVQLYVELGRLCVERPVRLESSSHVSQRRRHAVQVSKLPVFSYDWVDCYIWYISHGVKVNS